MVVWSFIVQGPSRLGTAAPTPASVVAPFQKLLGQTKAVTSCKGGTPAHLMPCSARTCCNRSGIDGSTPSRARTSQAGLCARGRPRLPLHRRLTAREARGRSSSSSRPICPSGQDLVQPQAESLGLGGPNHCVSLATEVDQEQQCLPGQKHIP